MSSPFTFFRRNQHVWMVAIVILSMVAFTISDMMTQSSNHFVTLGVLLGGGIFAFLGISQGRWIQYGIAGAVLGGVFGWVLPGVMSSPTGFYQPSALGTFDDQRIQKISRRRMIANTFVRQVCEQTQTQPQFFGGGSLEPMDLIFNEILRAEAKELQIVVTDPMVTSYLHELTSHKLTSEMFAETRVAMNTQGESISEPEIYDALREEIEANLAAEQLAPSSASLPQPPALYYELFKRSRVTQRLNTVRLDIDAFLNDVEEPRDAEIERLFAEYRLKYPGFDEPGSPGFRQPEKAKLAYLELGYKAVEATVTPPTDQEVEAYYNENKDLLYRKPQESPEAPAAPATPDGTTPPAPGESTDGKAPESQPSVTPEPGQESKETPAAPANDKKPEGDASPAGDQPAPAPDAPKPDAASETGAPGSPAPSGDASGNPPAESPKAGEDCFPFADPAISQDPVKSDPATAGQESKQDPAAATPAAPTQATPTTETKPAEAAAPAPAGTQVPAEGQPQPASEEPKPLIIPDAAQNPEKPEFVIPKVEYEPLDDERKAEIRDQLLDQKVQKALQEKMDLIMQDLRTIEQIRTTARRKIITESPRIEKKDLFDQLEPSRKQMLDDMKKLAEKYGASFVETRLLSMNELAEGEAYPIGAAADARRTSVVNDAFRSFFGQREFDPW